MTARACGLWSMLALCSLGCDSPADVTGPCGRAGACEVAGPDVAVTNVEVLADHGADATTQLPIANPRAMRIRYTVRNRGSIATAPRAVVITASDLADATAADSIGALAPGDSVQRSVIVQTSSRRIMVFTVHPRMAERNVAVRLAADSLDADPTNDSRATPFVVALPVLTVQVDPVAPPRLHVNQPFPITFRITNHSAHAAADSLGARVCLNDFDQFCFPRWWTFAADIDLPSIAPGATYETTRIVSLRPTATWQDNAQQVGMMICLVSASWSDPYLGNFARDEQLCYGSPGFYRTRPDYERACAPPVLSPGIALALTAHNCGLMPPTQQATPINYNSWRFHIVALDAVAGQTYRLERSNTDRQLIIYDEFGEPVTDATSTTGDLRFERPGRYYLVVYSPGPNVSYLVRTVGPLP